MLDAGQGVRYNVSVLSDALAETLDDRGISHRSFARTVGVSQQTVSRWARGEIVPRRDSVERIARGLGDDRRRWIDLWAQVEAAPTAADARRRLADAAELRKLRADVGRLQERLAALEHRSAG